MTMEEEVSRCRSVANPLVTSASTRRDRTSDWTPNSWPASPLPTTRNSASRGRIEPGLQRQLNFRSGHAVAVAAQLADASHITARFRQWHGGARRRGKHLVARAQPQRHLVGGEPGEIGSMQRRGEARFEQTIVVVLDLEHDLTSDRAEHRGAHLR